MDTEKLGGSYVCYEKHTIICPYCYEEILDEDYDVVQYRGEFVDMDCPECGRDFKVRGYVEPIYTSVRINEDGTINDDWDDYYDRNDEEDTEEGERKTIELPNTLVIDIL